MKKQPAKKPAPPQAMLWIDIRSLWPEDPKQGQLVEDLLNRAKTLADYSAVINILWRKCGSDLELTPDAGPNNVTWLAKKPNRGG